MTKLDKVDVEANVLNNHKLKVSPINMNVECSILGQNARISNPGSQLHYSSTENVLLTTFIM